MTKPTTYTASLNGQIIGTRKSHRTYTHAIIVQDSEEAAHARAYGYTATETDRDNFEFYAKTAAAAPGERVNYGNRHKHPQGDIVLTAKADEIETAKAKVEGGFDGFVARAKARAIESFEANKADGKFNPYVIAWAGRLDLAHKAAAQYTGPTRRLIALTDAVPTLPKKDKS